ncbi:hypothetical protein J5X84_02310 [Streptosporangiaceae bacterium NEAU-GS5]|nr:hypothetical protein [Streptosporangiaceae bacterium NEAU-GS5]
MTVPVPVVHPPLLGGDLWQQVAVERADGRCECRTQCGNPHKKDNGACTRLQAPGRPLHLAPRTDVLIHRAAGLPAADLLALCLPCYDGLDRLRRKDRRAFADQATQPEPLF